MDVVAENASQGLAQHRVKWLHNPDAIQEAMGELQEELSLPTSPRRMECYDISHIQGTNVVGSMVVFQDGKPKPAHYRRFKIKTVEGVDDYASMQEMLRRRFRRLGQARARSREDGGEDPAAPTDTWAIVPDLVLIDGGKGHLGAALQVFLELGIDSVPLASIAKENEEIFVPHDPEPILLPRSSQGLHLVQRVRDEAHRFAVTFHRQRRSKSSIASAMDLVPGVGPKRRKMLIRRFGSAKGVREASLEEIAAVPGMTLTLARRVKDYL
jgi:excinuclease ABC subunit C